MSGRYQTYPEYKDSGVEWLGKVPKHWKISRIKFFAALNPPKSQLKDLSLDTKVTFLPMETISEQGELDTTRVKQLKDVIGGYTFIEENDVCIAKITPCFENGKGAVVTGLKNGMAFGTTEIIPLRCFKKSDPKFLYYLLTASPFNKEAEGSMYGAGGQKRVSDNFVANYHFAVPSLTEREQIANFLDHETAKIDTLISRQEQLITLLKEKRQAVISHSVTKGLNPAAPMRDSGVEWLGEVPAHWEVTRAKHLFNFVTSGSRGWAEYYSDKGSLFFRIANLTRDTVEPKLESIQFVMPPDGSEGERSKIIFDDILISITADLGSVCVADHNVAGGYVSQHVSLCRPNSKVANSRWLGYVVLSDGTKEQFVGAGYGGTKIQLSLEDIREFWVAKPPEEEQIKLARYIDKTLDQYAIIISKAELQIALLQERRTALISAAVTGKIDVRHWQAPSQPEKNMEMNP